jgi:hypothetical protein
MANKALVAAALLFLPAGCATLRPPPHPRVRATVTVEEGEAWRNVATDEDARRLDALPQLLAEALADARRAGFARRIAAEQSLLAPAAGLPYAAPAPGPYSCRLLRLGVPAPGVRPFGESGRGFCFVGGDRDELSLTIEAGPRRMGGYLWAGKDNRTLVFLGAQSPRGVPIGGYGDNPMGDVAGLFQRIGPFHYRLILPARGGRTLTIVELRPAAEG